jgi:hypothetical protein
VTGGWSGLHDKFHNFSSSPSIIRIIKSRGGGRDGQGMEQARGEEKCIGYWYKSQRERDHH